jgi:hypothetical protein
VRLSGRAGTVSPEFRIETQDAGDLIIRRQNASGPGSRSGVGPGEPVVNRWHEKTNLVLVG